MKKLKYLVILLLSFVLITGCGTNTDEETSKKSDKKTETKEESKKDKNKKEENNKKEDKKKDTDNKKEDKKKPANNNSNDAALVCKMSQNDETMDMLSTVYFYYTENKLSDMNFNFDIDVKDESVRSVWSLFVEMLDEQFKAQYPISDQEGLELISSADENNYTYNLKINIDLDKAQASDVNNILDLDFDEYQDLEVPVADLKSALIENGFECQ